MDGLTEEEDAIVAVVRDFVDREVRPVVREFEGDAEEVLAGLDRGPVVRVLGADQARGGCAGMEPVPADHGPGEGPAHRAGVLSLPGSEF